MKTIIFRLASLALFLGLTMGLPACGNSEEKKEDQPKDTTVKIDKKGDKELPNYRYVDMDTVLNQYNLAKDYNEEMMRMQSSFENEVKKHESSIQSETTKMQNKMQNNGYLTEESFKADQDKLSAMQASAQKSLSSLQTNYESKAMAAQKTVNDSIEAYIKEYNAKKGYDAIFYKGATLYIDPALDITDEVVKGLNARYNKVK